MEGNTRAGTGDGTRRPVWHETSCEFSGPEGGWLSLSRLLSISPERTACLPRPLPGLRGVYAGGEQHRAAWPAKQGLRVCPHSPPHTVRRGPELVLQREEGLFSVFTEYHRLSSKGRELPKYEICPKHQEGGEGLTITLLKGKIKQ